MFGPNEGKFAGFALVLHYAPRVIAATVVGGLIGLGAAAYQCKDCIKTHNSLQEPARTFDKNFNGYLDVLEFGEMSKVYSFVKRPPRTPRSPN